MRGVVRKGIAFDRDILRDFDALIRARGYKNRSEAIRDLIRKELVCARAEVPSGSMVASLTITYNHHSHNLQQELTHIQHDHPGLILCTLHVHVDGEVCMEILALKGATRDIKRLSDRIISTKGVLHGELVLIF